MRIANRDRVVEALPGYEEGRFWVQDASAAIPARERVITCEEVFELRVPLPDVVSMQTRQPNLEGAGEIPLRRLVKKEIGDRLAKALLAGEIRDGDTVLVDRDETLDGLVVRGADRAAV